MTPTDGFPGSPTVAIVIVSTPAGGSDALLLAPQAATKPAKTATTKPNRTNDPQRLAVRAVDLLMRFSKFPS